MMRPTSLPQFGVAEAAVGGSSSWAPKAAPATVGALAPAQDMYLEAAAAADAYHIEDMSQTLRTLQDSNYSLQSRLAELAANQLAGQQQAPTDDASTAAAMPMLMQIKAAALELQRENTSLKQQLAQCQATCQKLTAHIKVLEDETSIGPDREISILRKEVMRGRRREEELMLQNHSLTHQNRRLRTVLLEAQEVMSAPVPAEKVRASHQPRSEVLSSLEDILSRIRSVERNQLSMESVVGQMRQQSDASVAKVMDLEKRVVNLDHEMQHTPPSEAISKIEEHYHLTRSCSLPSAVAMLGLD
mmetsp:Transcript_45021/g.106947  ORF Transcript_45021/g.106947 Transcript_45021/m.106947 type:complete len:302 (+) Transcript_45021:46-951(+)